MKSVVLCGAFLLLGFQPAAVDAQAVAKEPAKAKGQIRIALVSSGSGDNINSLLDLAQVKVSMQPGVELLDRQAMTRILQEQKLSLTGLVDANTAVRAGKLLGVDLFAFVEADPTSTDALGLIVYDAATGIKLHDAALPAGKLDEQIDAVSSGVRRAADKEAAGFKDLRTICLLSVRNADLPRAQDSLGHTVAFLLERHLLGSPKLAVLERKRLDFVTKEKMLPTEAKHKELLASVVMVDVEISRAGTAKAVRATAFLTDNQGNQLGKVQVEEADPKAGSLAEKLQSALLKHWQADPPAKAPDPGRESKRFHQEGKRLYSQKEWQAAVQALDAAYALDPLQPQLHLDLAKYLGDQGYAILFSSPRAEVNKRWTMQVPTAKFKDAVNVGLRSVEMRRMALHKLPKKNFDALKVYYAQYSSGFAPPNIQLVDYLKKVDPQFIDEEASQLREQFYDQYRRMLREELERWVEIAREDAESPKPSSAVEYLTKNIQRATVSMRTARVEKTDIEMFLLPFYRVWLEITALPGITHSNGLLAGFCQENVPICDEYAEFLGGMSKHPHPLLKLYGRWYRLRLDMKNENVAAGQAQITYQELRQDAFKTLRDHKPDPKSAPQDDLRTTVYQFLFMAMNQWPYPNPDQKYQERFALVDHMLNRQELNSLIVIDVAQPEYKAKNPRHSQRWDLTERVLKMLEAGTPQLCESPSHLKFLLLEVQKNILAERPDFDKRLTLSVALWSRADHLINLKKHSTFNQLGVPLVDGDSVYVAGAGTEKSNYVLCLLRISLGNKNSQMLGKAILRPVLGKERMFAINQITATCLTKDHVFVGTKIDGLYAFDRAGVTGKLISKDLPNQEIEGLTYHDGKLYVALRGGFLIAFDSASGNFETLASSRRRERLSPFDDSDVFRIPYLVTDSERNRLLFLLYQKPNKLIYYSSAEIPPKETTNGLWEYDFKTKTFKRHLELYYEALLWGSPIRDGHVLLSKPGLHHTGVMDFDLAHNKGKLLWALNHIGPNLPKDSATSQAVYYPFTEVRLQRGNWLWCARPFSRASLTEHRQEFLPLDEKSESYSTIGFALEPIGADQLLLANPTGLWLLKMTKGN